MSWLKLIIGLLPSVVLAATFTVAPSGGDYTTIQACANVANPGDTCAVQPGTYTEIVDVSRSGINGNPITFVAQGAVIVSRFNVTGNYIRIEGFTFGDMNGYLYSLHTYGNYTEIVNNTFGPVTLTFGAIGLAGGTGCRVIGNSIVGLNMGTAINIIGVNHLIENNIIRDSSDIDAFRAIGNGHVIRRNVFMDIIDGPVGNHIDFIQTFGQSYQARAYDILVEQNFVKNVEGQISQLTQGCGTDPSGSAALGATCSEMAEVNGAVTSFTSNSLTDSARTWLQGQWLENHWAGSVVHIVGGAAVGKTYLIASNTNTTLTLTNLDETAANLTTDGVQVGDSYEIRMRVGWWTFRNNIFIDIVQATSSPPGITWTNNTFYNVPQISLNDSSDRGRSFDATITNNVHLWSTFNGILYYPPGITVASFRGDYNYASLGPTEYGAKRAVCSSEYTAFSFCEAVWPGKHGINGGDPKFADITNPLGPDGIPFTLDDGLKPLPNSPLCATGEHGVDIGAYSCNPNVVFSGGEAGPAGPRVRPVGRVTAAGNVRVQ